MGQMINRKTVLLSEKGGSLHFVRDGEVLASVHVPAGRVRAAQYLDLVPEGASIALSDDLVPLETRHRVGIQPYGERSHDSGANPDFRPTSASRMEREMRLTLSKMQATTARLEARERQLQKIQRIPTAKPAEPVEPQKPVTETIPEAKPSGE